MGTVKIAMMLLVLGGLLLVHGEDVTPMEYDDLLPAGGTNPRQRVDTDVSTGDHRHGRMSSHGEVPSAKAKREQVLRNILAARRRKILSQRPPELSRSSTVRSRSTERTFKESADTLEAQETRHGVYVTAASSGLNADSSIDEETYEAVTRMLGKSGGTEMSSMMPKVELVTRDPVSEQALGQTSRKPGDENSTVSSIDESKPASGNSRSNYSLAHRNSTWSLPSDSSSSTSSSFIASNQKSTETETRKKSIVAMPESLYNYFRPVESNIPVEDMSQFLYFGQKIQPEGNNNSNNNTVDVTPTIPTLASSRRRYSTKRFSTTTPIAVSKLEEIMNEEMNIAVEKPTVERNKVSKLKNSFRSSENGLYYRKSRPTDPTISSNVIPVKEQGTNATGTEAKDGTGLLGDKFRDDNPSAHAATHDQLQHTAERGSTATAHVLAETRNATNSTQIPHQQPVSSNMGEESIVESEISFKDQRTNITVKAPLITPENNNANSSSRRKKTGDSFLLSNIPVGSVSALKSEDEKNLKDDIQVDNFDASFKSKTGFGEHFEQKLRRSDVFDETDFTEFSTSNEEEMQMDQSGRPRIRENNTIETSTSREKLSRSTTETSFLIQRTSLPIRSETSTLRIIVPEENLGHSLLAVTDSTERNTVKPVDSTEERVRSSASGGVRPLNSLSASSTMIGSTSISQVGSRSSDMIGSNEKQSHQQQQQQHVYAYTITNVTRLLRNYTGPGLSREESGSREESSGGASEITSGSGQRRETPPPQLPQSQSQSNPQPQPPQPTGPVLPRAGSGIESGRAPAELSAGRTVEATRAAGGASTTADSQVGERPRKVAAVAPQRQQRAPTRATSAGQLTVNKSIVRSARPGELATRGTVRWNHTKTRNSDLEALGDRKLLRKTASAVLNQRIGGLGNDEDIVQVTGKRRRVTNGQSGFSTVGRRLKGPGLNNTSESGPIMGVTNRSLGLHDTLVSSEKTIQVDERMVQDALEEASVEEAVRVIGIGQGDGMGIVENNTMESVAVKEETVAVNVFSSTESVLENSLSRASVDETVENGASNLKETVASMSENITSDTKDKNNATLNDDGNRIPVNIDKVFNSSSRSVVESTDNTRSSSTVTVTAAVDESSVVKETTSTMTTVPAPVFPVTPRILTEAGRVPIEKETFTLKPPEPENQVTGTKTTEPQSSSITTGNLDPSEIQRRYRSKNVTTTIQPAITSTTQTSTTLTSSAPTEQSTFASSQDQRTASGVNNAPNTTVSDMEARRHIPGERSPEVRARNLSDKTKDKDDVLPIMQLYNTSAIFNGSALMDSFSHTTEQPPVELPVSSEPSEKPQEPSRTIEKIVRPENAPSNPTSVPVTTSRTSDSKEPQSTTPITTRKDKIEEHRETIPQVPPTIPGRGSTLVNGSATNRTKYRPVYNPSILPEYNNSLYPIDLNRTYFETGLISVSRESVNISEVISRRHDSDAIASQDTVAVVSYILATLVVFPIAVGVGLILRRLILRNRKVLEESDTSSEISCRKDALNLENGDFKTSIEKAITKLPRIQHLCHEAEKPPPPSLQESRWEFPRDKLRLQTVLGQGNFGQVWKAEADDLSGHQGTTRLVAVKTVKEGASDREKEDLDRELEIMKQLGSHHNVVTLLGCCTEQEPHYLILEYVMYGKLLAYLRDHRTRQDFYNFSEDSAALTSRDLTVFGYCVARGMEYLASKKIIHRDLAARNVLVDHNKLCKIADFGMSRFANEDGEVIETRHGRNALPIRWMAPESLIYSLFTTKTDVWSFGILMWEIVTLGSTPYPDMTAREVMRNVQNGYRLERPSHCRSELFRVIARCWHADPDRRPEFQTLRREFAQLLEDNLNGHYVDLESFASECTD